MTEGPAKHLLRLVAFLDNEVANSARDDQQHHKKPTHDEMESFH
jgi:hypothetical protein